MPNKDKFIKRNTGVLPIIGALPTNKSYINGIISGVPYEEILLSMLWKQYRSTGEKQHSLYFDSRGCVSFSFNNGVEEGINFLKQTGILTDEVVNSLLPNSNDQALFWEFFNDNGEADLSDRGLAKLSDTDLYNGNSLFRVFDIGKDFALPERVWGYPREQRTPVFDWDDFYKDIPVELVEKYSQVFFSVFKITGEFFSPSLDNIKKHLKQAPIQIASGWCPDWGVRTPIRACDRHNEHATVIDGLTANDDYEDYDTYNPFGKVLAKDYKIDGALKIIVSIKELTINKMIVKENYLYQLVEGVGGFALGLNGKLIIDDLAKILASWSVRNNGFTAGKVLAVSQKDWDSVDHYNLKMQIVE